MGLIVYDEKTLIEAKNRIDSCNEEILNALEKINYEFNNINSTLDTPKSGKSIHNFIDNLNKNINYVRNNKENYNKVFDVVNAQYHEYTDTVNRMVGVNNEK